MAHNLNSCGAFSSWLPSSCTGNCDFLPDDDRAFARQLWEEAHTDAGHTVIIIAARAAALRMPRTGQGVGRRQNRFHRICPHVVGARNTSRGQNGYLSQTKSRTAAQAILTMVDNIDLSESKRRLFCEDEATDADTIELEVDEDVEEDDWSLE